MSERGSQEKPETGGRVASAPPSSYLTFQIAGETYAAGILNVREILQYEAVTRVPNTPGFIHGVMNLRGSVVPVVDLAAKFGLPKSAVTRRTCVILVEISRSEDRLVIGVIADSVSDVAELHARDIEPPPPFGPRVKVDFLLGMGRTDAGFLLILDLDRVLSERELVLTSALRESGAASDADARSANGTTARTPGTGGARPVQSGRATGMDGVLPEDVLKAGGRQPAKKTPEVAPSAERLGRGHGGEKAP